MNVLVFVNFICIILSCKLYKNAIYVGLFAEVLNYNVCIFAYRKLFNQHKNSPYELKWLIMICVVTFLKIQVLYLVANYMIKKKRCYLYLINAIATTIPLVGMLYSIFGFNTNDDIKVLNILPAVVMCSTIPL